MMVFVRMAVTMRMLGLIAGRHQDQAALVDTLEPTQVGGEMFQDAGSAAEDDDLQAAVMVQMDVRARHHPFGVFVLNLDELVRQSGAMMVVDER